MFSRILLVLPAVALAVSLSACTAPTASPDPRTATPTAEATGGAGDFVPDGDWFAGLDAARNSLSEYVGSWNTQECAYQKVIDGDFNCTIHLSGIQEHVLEVDSYLVDVVNIAPGFEDLVAGLSATASDSAAAAASAEAFSASGCDFSPGDSCTQTADELVDLAQRLDVALAGWETPPLD